MTRAPPGARGRTSDRRASFLEDVKTNEKTKSANCVECKAAIYALYVSLHHVHSFKLTRPSLSRA